LFSLEGRRHDAVILADSGLLNNLQRIANSPAGQPYCIYGDPAYPLRVHLQAPFRYGVLTPQLIAFNQSMSSVRESVEWLFNDIVTSFKFRDFKKNLKIGLSCIGKMYVVSAILRIALTCLYGNETSSYLTINKNLLVIYCKSCILIGYRTHYLSADIFFFIGIKAYSPNSHQ
jgi:hypothetical protein